MSAVRSIGEIARQLGEPIHRVDYIVRSRAIQPAIVAGGRKLYGDEAFAVIKAALTSGGSK